MADILKVENLKKNYGKVTAVDGISFAVPEGDLYAFLGPNGAGKSTTIHCICTLLAFDSGSIRLNSFIAGKQDGQIRNSIGVVFQESLLDNYLTVRENLAVRASMYGIKGAKLKTRLGEIMQSIDIAEFLDRRYGQLSGGQKRRADIARGMIHSPKMLFLDEPTTGLDPQTRARVWESVGKMQRDSGVTVFLTTHYMEEAARADRVAIMDHGKLIAEDTPANLRKKHSSHKLRLYPKPGSVPELQNIIMKNGLTANLHDDRLTIRTNDSMAMLGLVQQARDFITDFELLRGSMDDVFLELTGREIREGNGVA